MSRYRVLSTLLALLLAGFALAADRPNPAAEEKGPWDPTSDYTPRSIEGWRVLVNKRLLTKEHEELHAQTMKLLEDHLYRITRVVPAGPLAKLRKIPIWVELNHPLHPCMCYHISARWLRDHDMNPAKAGGVELANAQAFLTWTIDQPWMVLHELAHGYHDLVLGTDDPAVHACYEQAVASKAYESVLHIGGGKRRHYALNNDQEYFAETTEAFFGTNDYFPFTRAELRQHDPKGFELMEKVWDVKRPVRK
jgi:hypothetical protein